MSFRALNKNSVWLGKGVDLSALPHPKLKAGRRNRVTADSSPGISRGEPAGRFDAMTELSLSDFC